LLRAKKTANKLNVYFIKNTFLSQQSVSSSVVFYITGLPSLKLKQLQVFSQKKEYFPIFTIFGFLIFLFLFSFIFTYVWLVVVTAA